MNNVTEKNIIGFKEYLVRNDYSNNIIPMYTQKVKSFFEYKDSGLFQKNDFLKLKYNIIEYMVADLKLKENALNKVQEPVTKRINRRYHGSDTILRFLKSL